MISRKSFLRAATCAGLTFASAYAAAASPASGPAPAFDAPAALPQYRSSFVPTETADGSAGGHAAFDPSTIGASHAEAAFAPEDASGIPPTDFQPPPAPAASEQPPVPLTTSEPAASPAPGDVDHGTLGGRASQAAPWNPGPPTGIALTPPGEDYPTVKITGFFQADAAWYSQSTAHRATIGDEQDGAPSAAPVWRRPATSTTTSATSSRWTSPRPGTRAS